MGFEEKDLHIFVKYDKMESVMHLWWFVCHINESIAHREGLLYTWQKFE